MGELVLDLIPGKTGKVGQILLVDYSEGNRVVIADSLESLIKTSLKHQGVR